MTSAQKKSNRRRKAMVAVYILALLGGYTVTLNIYSALACAVSYSKAWVTSLEFRVPVLVSEK